MNAEFSTKNSRETGKQAASKTACNFTAVSAVKPYGEPLSVNLDWLSFRADAPVHFFPSEQQIFEEYGEIVLEHQKRGAGMFLNLYKVFWNGEHVAHLLSGPRDAKTSPPDVVKVEILNHVLYSSETPAVIEAMCKELGLCIRNTSRIDISIDGANRLPVFMNGFLKQKRTAKRRIEIVGKAKPQGKVFDKKYNFNSFKIGGAEKSIVIYNKTSELEYSHKNYIRAAWDKAGIDYKGQDVWRTELRLNSEGLKCFKDFDLKRCFSDPIYLMSVFRTACKGFFEFRAVENDSNITRARPLDVLNFEKFRIPLLEKIPRAKVDGHYKARMGIHQDVKSMVQGLTGEADGVAALHNMKRNLDFFDLWGWYNKKLPEWIETYSRQLPTQQQPQNLKPLLELCKN